MTLAARQTIRECTRALSLVLLLAGLLASRAVADPSTRKLPALEVIADAFGIERSDVEALRRGERVGGDLESVSENELSLSIGLRTPQKPSFYWDRIIDGRSFESDPTVLHFGAIGDDAAASLAELKLPEDEIERLASAEPGKDVNFSSDEIAKLRAIAESNEPDTRNDALLEGFRAILVSRLEAYRVGGLGAVSPYDRGGGKVGAPAVELGRALGELRATREIAPRAYDSLVGFPRVVHEGVESHLYWVVNGAEGEMIVSLVHRVSATRDDHIAVIEHRFYVNHMLNSLQAVSVVVPVENGSVVIYANRTFTDLVSGFAAPIARGIGRTIMRSKIDELADALESVDTQ